MLTSVLSELVKPPPPSGMVPVGQAATTFVWVPAGFVTIGDSTTL
jgi:hypothetical protein